jgi:hypothetical protein
MSKFASRKLPDFAQARPARRRCNTPMPRLLALALTVLCAALFVAAPAVAADRPQDVQRVERAVLELDRAKRSLVGDVSNRQAALERSLGSCKSKGKGWKRLRRVRNRSQVRTYRRAARMLWAELHRVAHDRGALEVDRPIFERFLSHFDTPVGDPVLAAGVDAHRHRLAYYEAATSFATCKTFNRLMRSVRPFGGNAEGDARAGDVFTKLSTYVANREAAAVRKYWGSRYERALQAARVQLKALGGNGGYADYFAFALALRV